MTDENQRQLNDCATEISQIKAWINTNPLDSNVRYLTAYAVVKASGSIEIVLKSMIHLFLSDGAKKETQLFLTKQIVDSSSNPSTGKIESMLDQFDATTKELFKSQIHSTQDKADLNSLVTLRNDIAHGRTISASIGTIERYFESGRRVLDILDNLLNENN